MICEGNFEKQFWKCIGCVFFGSYLWDKRMQYWGKSHEYDHGRMTGKIKKEVRGKTHLLKVSCYLHHFNFCSYRHLNMLSYTNVSIYWMSLCMLTSLFFISLCCVLHKFQRIITPCLYSFCREFFLVTREKLIKEWPGIVLKQFLVVEHVWPLGTSTTLGMHYDLFILRGV